VLDSTAEVIPVIEDINSRLSEGDQP